MSGLEHMDLKLIQQYTGLYGPFVRGDYAIVRFYPHLGSFSEAYPGTVSGSQADREQTGDMVFCSIFWQ